MGDHPRTVSWKLLGGAVAGLLLLGSVSFFVWYVSTADLDAVRAQARIQGVATTWEEFRPDFAPDLTLIAQFNRLAHLSKKLQDYDSQSVINKTPVDKRRDRLRPFWPVPAAARAFHVEQDPEVVAEALAILDGLPARRLVLSDGQPKNRLKDKYILCRQMARWLGERVLLADDDHVFTEVYRLLKFIQQIDINAELDFWIEISLISIAAPIVADHLPLLQQHTEKISEILNVLESRLVADMRASLVASFVEELKWLENPADFSRSMGVSSDTRWWEPVLNPLRVRSARAPVLAFTLEHERQLASLGLGYDYVVWIKSVQQRHAAMKAWESKKWLFEALMYGDRMIGEMVPVSRMQLQVLIAEIRGEPWPIDLFDPAGQPVRRLTRDGQIIGAYSFGPDQKDDGGDPKKDRQFLLFGAWEQPPPAP